MTNSKKRNMNIKVIIATSIACMTIFLGGCDNADSASSQSSEIQTGKALVLVYSKTGNTMAVAENIKQLLNADMLEVEPATPYPDTYNETLPVATQEIEDIDQKDAYPKIKTTISSMENYEIIVVCSPIWWSRIATPMQAFLHNYSNMTDGKTMTLAVTSGATGIETAWEDLQRLTPKAKHFDGIRISTSNSHDAEATVKNWLIEIGLYSEK